MNPQPITEKLKLRAGEIHVIALQQLNGRPVKSNFGGADQIMFTLTDGRKLFVDPYVQDRIRTLSIAPGEPFEIAMLENIVGNQRSVSVEVRRKTAGAPAQAAPIQAVSAQSQPHPTAPPMYIPPAYAPPPLPPAPYTPPAPPPPAPAPQGPVNGAGETHADIMARCYCSAVDIALATMACAEKKNLRLTVQFEDIRAMGTAMMIAETGRR